MSKLPKQVGKDWRDSFRLAGVCPKEKTEISISDFSIQNCLVVTPCSAIKSNLSIGLPIEIYKGSLICKLAHWASRFGISWGVLSDKYGLVFADEIIKNYNIAPGDLSYSQSAELAKIIQGKIKKETVLVIYHPRPMQTWHWIRKIESINIKKWYIRSLPNAFNNLLFKE